MHSRRRRNADCFSHYFGNRGFLTSTLGTVVKTKNVSADPVGLRCGNK